MASIVELVATVTSLLVTVTMRSCLDLQNRAISSLALIWQAEISRRIT